MGRLDAIDLPQKFYRAAWTVVLGGGVLVEFIAILDDDKNETASAYLRPFIQQNTVTKLTFLFFTAWLIKHFIIDRGPAK